MVLAQEAPAERAVPAESEADRGLGISLQIPRVADSAVPQWGAPVVRELADDWQLEFHGYLRAPMRVGITTLDDPAPEQRALQFHTPPFVPDGNYTAWTFTNNVPGPWVETFLSAGTSRVRATVMLASYSITDAGWRDVKAQLGINQAFITVRAPGFLGSAVDLEWNVGSFMNRYGTAGRYDAGRYDTYLFGRTHVMGETLTLNWRTSDKFIVHFEHGVGAKVQPPTEPDPNHEVPVGSTLIHHAHAGVSYRKRVQLAAHHLMSFASDAARLGNASDGLMAIHGLELRLKGGGLGDGYIGYSHIKAENVGVLADAIEVLHSFSGYQFQRNFLGPNSQGYGTVHTLAWQATFSTAAFLRRPAEFWGDAPDFIVTLFGMFNSVASRDPKVDGTKKLKWGAEALYTPFAWLGTGLRMDVVQPDLADANQSFTVLSPKVVLRTEWLSHEQFVLQYSTYFNGKSVFPSWPNQNEASIDQHVVMLLATIWW